MSFWLFCPAGDLVIPLPGAFLGPGLAEQPRSYPTAFQPVKTPAIRELSPLRGGAASRVRLEGT